MSDLARRLPLRITPDPARVLARLFVPGHEQLDTESRATGVLARILRLDDAQVTTQLAHVRTRFAARHRDFDAVLARTFALLAHRIPDGQVLTHERQLLLGAFFTHEFSVEAAALFNPSVVAHPDQSGVAPGDLRFVMSLRAVGEGHLSSVELRTGTYSPGGRLALDAPSGHLEQGERAPAHEQRALFAALLEENGADDESSRFLLSRLPATFAPSDLVAALAALEGQATTRHGGAHTAVLARRLAQCRYTVTFDPASSIDERVLWPEGPTEERGIEDVRLVTVTLEDGSRLVRGTYTAYDGRHIAPQALSTRDFRTFDVGQLAGPGARNKGLAFFPRPIGGRMVALSRWDRENCSVTTSEDGLRWDEPRTVHGPSRPWELIQTGNCGSPLETDRGWLVLTHGVGPMRTYSMGALLLDLDDPTRVVGVLDEPLLAPDASEREGYVPNVVYSCGAVRHGDEVLLPYGASDSTVRFATLDLPEVLDRLTDPPPA